MQLKLTKDSDRAAGGFELRADFLSWNYRGRLISLFDIVKEFLAHAVYSDGRGIQKIVSFMEGIDKPKALLREEHCTSLTELITNIGSGCEYFDLPASKKS